MLGSSHHCKFLEKTQKQYNCERKKEKRKNHATLLHYKQHNIAMLLHKFFFKKVTHNAPLMWGAKNPWKKIILKIK